MLLAVVVAPSSSTEQLDEEQGLGGRLTNDWRGEVP